MTAYLLGYTVAMPLVGGLSDVYGRQRVLVGCLVLLGLGSAMITVMRMIGMLVGLSMGHALSSGVPS